MSAPNIESYNAALDFLQAGKIQDALQSVENSLMEDAGDSQTWQLYIMILKTLGRDEDAEKATAKLKELGLSEVDESLMQAAAALSAGDAASAVAHYQAALDLEPERPEIHTALALALMETSDAEGALAAAHQAVALAPDDAQAHYSLGRILRLTGDKESALDSLDKAVAIDPGLMMAVYEQGMLLAEKGRMTEALANFEKFLKAHPGDEGATQAITGIKAELGRTTTF
jgi:tetratricopeptide (TPR) repeat protein